MTEKIKDLTALWIRIVTEGAFDIYNRLSSVQVDQIRTGGKNLKGVPESVVEYLKAVEQITARIPDVDQFLTSKPR